MTMDRALAAVARPGHPDLVEQVGLDEVRVRLAADLLDDQAEQECAELL